MSNELENFPTKSKDRRKARRNTELTATVMVWTISGLTLSACGGGSTSRQVNPDVASPTFPKPTGGTVNDTLATDTAFDPLTGNFEATDDDNDDAITYSVAEQAVSAVSGFTHMRAGTYGVLHFNQNSGAWRYVVNAPAVDELASGASETDSFAVTATDTGGLTATQNLDITVNGVDEAALVVTAGGSDDTAVTVDLDNGENGDASASGKLTATRHNDPASGATFEGTGAQYGTFTIDNDGSWTYTLTATSLPASTTDTITVMVRQGGSVVPETITIGITVIPLGTNNTPPMVNPITGATIDDTTAVDTSFTNPTGTFTVTDPDVGYTPTFTVTGAVEDASESGFTHRVDGDYGELFYDTTSGAWRYVVNASAVDAVAAGVVEADSFTVRARDQFVDSSNTQNLVITINGADENIAPRFPKPTGGTVTDTPATDTSFDDLTGRFGATDSGDTISYSVAGQVFNPATINFTVTGDYGVLHFNETTGVWRYVVTASAVDALDDGASAMDSFAVTATDTGGLTATQNLDITVNGADEAVLVVAAGGSDDTAVTLDLDGGGEADNSASGRLTAMRHDLPASGATFDGTGAQHGTFNIDNDGNWTYTLTATSLAASTTDTITVMVSQGGSVVPETITIDITVIPRGTDNTPPMVNPITGASIDDTTAVDISFDSQTGTFTATDPDPGDTPTFSVTGAVEDVSVGGFTHRVDGDYGELFYDTVSGVWRYFVNVLAVDGVAGGVVETDSFTVTARDLFVDSSNSQNLVITINGADENVAPVFLKPTGGTVNDTPATDTAFDDLTGRFGATDSGDTISYSVAGQVFNPATINFTVTGDYGVLHFNETTGVWRYVVTASAVDALANGASAMDSFTVTATDTGDLTATQNLDITVNGADEAALVVAAGSGDDTAVTLDLDGGGEADNSASGRLTAMRHDLPASGATFDGTGAQHGTFTIDDDGHWTYTLTATSLPSSTTDTITVMVSQGGSSVPETITIDITVIPRGTDNRPPMVNPITGASIDDTTAVDISFDSQTGTFTATDPDPGDTPTFSVTGAVEDASVGGFTHRVDGDYGELFYDTVSGVWRYFVNVLAVDGVAGGITETDSFTVTARDLFVDSSNTQNLVITINGADENVAPVFSKPTGGTVNDTLATDTAFVPLTGNFEAADDDAITYSVQGQEVSAVSGFTHMRAGTYGVLHFSDNLGYWQYVVTASAVDALNSGASAMDSFAVTATDTGGLTAEQNLDITVNGVDEAALVVTAGGSDDTSVTLDLDDGGRADNSASGRLTATRHDAPASGATFDGTGAQHGTFNIDNDGNWTYTLTVSSLPASTTDTITVMVSQGGSSVPETITIDITVIDNTPPEVDAITGATITDTTAVDTSFTNPSGTFTVTDPDPGDTHSFMVAGAVADVSVGGFTHRVDGDYGWLFYNTTSGAWRYDADIIAIDDLVGGITETDSFTVTARDLFEDSSNSQELVVTINGADEAIVVVTANKIINLATINGNNGFKITGERNFDNNGISVASAGDVNGDNIDDLIIGADRADPNGGNSGSSYVVFGKDTRIDGNDFAETVRLSALDGTNGFKIHGEHDGDYSGGSVSSAGDVNGDGIDDLIIGANGANSNGTDSGSSYVVFGKDTRVEGNDFAETVRLSALDGTNGFKINGEYIRDNSGISVSSAGDVNGDNIDDIIIGADGADSSGSNSGSSYVVFGKDTRIAGNNFAATVELSNLNGTNGFKITGERPNDYSGYSVSSAGDVNGDNIDDIIIGAHGAGESGSSYVVFGKDTRIAGNNFAATIHLSTLDGTDGFKITGETAEDYSGYSVSSAGDVNGDNIDDIIIGAHGAGESGSSYVLLGRDTRVPGNDFAATIDLSNLNGINGIKINGESAADNSGISVSSAGDVNGDDVDDIIIGAPGAGESGSSYVVFGPAIDATTISGALQVGQTLKASTVVGTGIQYIWKRCDDGTEEIVGMGRTYTLVEDDFDTTIKVEISYTDPSGELITIQSDATPTIGRRSGSIDYETITGTGDADANKIEEFVFDDDTVITDPDII